MEPLQIPLAYHNRHISDHEREKASNSYLMSIVAIMVGLPLPIINLLATAIFYLGNRKGTYFVRWHCTQAFFSQLLLFCMNSVGFWWTVGIIFRDERVTDRYFAYIATILLFNIVEFVTTIYAAIQVRKGHHIQIWFLSGLTNLVVRK